MYRPGVQPVTIVPAGTATAELLMPPELLTSPTSSSLSSATNNPQVTRNTTPEKRQSQQNIQILDAIKQMPEDDDKRQQGRLSLMKEIHGQKMQMFGQFLEILKANQGSSQHK